MATSPTHHSSGRRRTRYRLLGAALVVILLAPLTALLAPTASAAPKREKLEMYTLEGTASRIAAAAGGVELAGVRQTASGIRADAVLTESQRAKVAAAGVKVTLKRNNKGQTVSEQAAAQAAGGFQVWRSWDQPGGIRDELFAVARQNPQLVKLEVLGRSHQGRELIALKVTQSAREVPDGSRPAVLYSSNQHAREWISLEVNRRLLQYFIGRWRANDKAIKDLLKSTELWFVISANPDGYQYTFDVERLWRKNLRDNNGDGQITVGDGVDPNRNFAEHWGYDNEGSSPDPADETYRGPSAASEPETRALAGLIDRIKPKFQSNLHSFGQWLLYPQGWQVATLDADYPIYVALGGTDGAKSAIPGFNPGQSADTLYVTNGETTDYAETNAGTIAYTPELGEGIPGAGFVFPDDERLIQAEFEKTLPFHLGLARSAQHPATPESPVGIGVDPFYLDADDIDPQNGQQSLFDFRFGVSYGDPQEVRVLAKRSLGAVTLRYQVNDGPAQSGSTSEWTGGERYGPGNGVYYHVVRGNVTGTAPGDSVKVWFTGGGATSDSFTYTVESDSGRRVLVVAAEDYTGASPAKTPIPTAPQYLSFYTDALTANGVAFDVYDVDAHGRTAPDNLGVLGHYDAVIWYTGDDVVTRERGWGAGNASRLAMQELLEVRDFANAGGRVLYTGQRAGQQYTTALGTQRYDPFENRQCSADPAVQARCLALSGSGDSQGDPIEYLFGATITTPFGGSDPQTGEPFDVAGIDTPLAGLAPWGFNGADSAQNQTANSSFIATGDFLKVTDPAHSFPQFDSWPAAEYQSGLAGPFDPHSGQSFMWSERADEAYKRLTRTITVPAGGATLSFWTSFNLELNFDYLIVEAHAVGQDDWTTLPDRNGHTSSDLSADQACTGGWSNPADAANVLHPFLTHYQTFDPAAGTCSSTGTTGSWNAANGSSSGWQQLEFDLSPYAGRQVELSITSVSDWGFQQFPGVFIDDIAVSTGEGSTSFEDDADPLDGWTVPGAPQDPQGIEGTNRNDWTRRGGLGIKEGAAVATGDTLYMGFGLEGITGASTRNQIMRRAIDYLLR
ncbi:MAG TPA: M14 family zinc carboxypeptidase [Micromonosporaceae bacterium]|nr:M14 family zinc carboxypeptidase [Micromonosporaceae bacterium]